MSTNRQKIARNAAKVEFIANAEEIMSMLSKGFNKRNTYDTLIEKGRLTMSYRSFCWNLQQFENPQKEKKKKSVVSTLTPAAPSSPILVASKKQGFGQIEDVDMDKLI